METLNAVPTQKLIKNRFLRALPDLERERLAPHLQRKKFEGDTIYASGQPINGLYFPDEGLLQAHLVQHSSRRAFSVLLGQTALAGIDTIPGTDFLFRKVEVMQTSNGWWLPAEILREEWKARGEFSVLLAKYFEAHSQVLETVCGCRYEHSMEQQLCVWLMLAHDWTHDSTIHLSIDSLANFFDTTYTQTVLALSQLWKRNVLRFNNDSITILDFAGLLDASCSCYSHVQSLSNSAHA
jgi:CRP-like cAMP-binding protein